MTISVLYIVQLHAGKKRRAAQWKLCCGILLKLESLKRGKRKSLLLKESALDAIENEQKYAKARQSTLLRVGGRGTWSAFILVAFSVWIALKFRHERCLFFAPNWSKS